MSQNEAAATDAHWSVAPYFIVDDVVASANFYRDTLGFQYRSEAAIVSSTASPRTLTGCT
jgi:hypothetical protein